MCRGVGEDVQAYQARGFKHFEFGCMELSYYDEASVELVLKSRLSLGEMDALLFSKGSQYDEFGSE